MTEIVPSSVSRKEDIKIRHNVGLEEPHSSSRPHVTGTEDGFVEMLAL